MEGNVLALIENVVMPLHEVLNAVRMVKKEAVEKINPLIVTQASSLSTISHSVLIYVLYLFTSLIILILYVNE